MTTSEKPIKVVRVNPEHSGIRFGVVLSLFAGLGLGFLVIRYLILTIAPGTPLSEFVFVISCLLAIPLSLLIAWLSEQGLKKVWSSGMALIVEDRQIRFAAKKNKRSGTDISDQHFSFQMDRRINLTRWYFSLRGFPRGGRERMIPSNWHCLACQLQQDDKRLILFSFLSPGASSTWIENPDLSEPFEKISLAEVYKNDGLRRWANPTRPAIDAALLTGSKGRFWIAEKRRWEEGLEIAAQDFTFFTNYIEQRN